MLRRLLATLGLLTALLTAAPAVAQPHAQVLVAASAVGIAVEAQSSPERADVARLDRAVFREAAPIIAEAAPVDGADDIGKLRPGQVAHGDAPRLQLAQALVVTPSFAAIFGHHGGVVSPYVLPDLSTGFIDVDGDSRNFNTANLNFTGTTVFQAALTYALGVSGHLGAMSNNVLVFNYYSDMGKNGSTTARARAAENSVNPRCNDGSAVTTSQCWSGTRITTNAPSSAGATVIHLPNVTGLVVGMYVNGPIAGYANIPAGTTITSFTGNDVNISAALTGTGVANAAAITFSPAADQNQFQSFIGANAGLYGQTDVDGHPASTGAYSPCTSPSNIDFALMGINDSFAILQTLTNIQAYRDQLGPGQCAGAKGKLVVLADEMPRGASTAFNQRYTIASHTLTPSIPGSNVYLDDISVVYAPDLAAGGTGGGTLGTSDGVKLTKVGSSPTTGQYTVNNATGVYTFASDGSDDGKQVSLNFRFTVGGATTANQLIIRDYCKSTATGSYTFNAVTYTGITGGFLSAPHARCALTFEATEDGSGSHYPAAWFGPDATGVHPGITGGRAAAAAVYAAIAADVGSTSKVPAPTVNNPVAATAVSSASATGVTSCSVSHPTSEYLTGLVPAASSGLYVVGQTAYPPVASGITSGVVDCVDTTNNRVHLASIVGTPAGATNSNVGFVSDTANVLWNGLMDAADVPATPPSIANCKPSAVDLCGTIPGGTKTVPVGWTFGPGANAQTAIGNSPQLLQINYGVLSNGAFSFSLSGRSLAALGTTLQFTPPAAMLARITPGDKVIAACKISVGPGPNGRLYGLSSVSRALTFTTTAFAPFSGAPGTITSAGSAVGSAPAVEWSDGDMAAANPTVDGGATYIIDTTGMAISAGPLLLTFTSNFNTTTNANSLVSATVTVQQCQIRKM